MTNISKKDKLIQGDKMKKDIIMACTDLGLKKVGTENGPTLLYNEIKSLININDTYVVNKKLIEKDLKENIKLRNLEAVNDFNKKLYQTVTTSLVNGSIPITLGGDHSIAIGSALASINHFGNLGIIWIDAHSDFNTDDTTVSGNIHGLPLAAITGYKNKMLVEFHKGNFYNPNNTVLVGTRSIDLLEQDNLKKCGITVFTTDDIKNLGVDEVMNRAWIIANHETSGVHISVDLDIIDPLVAPGVSVPELNGINNEEAILIAQYLYNHTNDIKSLDLVEYNPLLDIDNKTLNLAISMLKIIINDK